MTAENPPGLDLRALGQWLSDTIPGWEPTSRVEAELLAGGRSNLTYRIVDGAGRPWALRRPPLGHVLPSAHDMAREARVLSGLSAVGYPVPRVHGLAEDARIIGAPFLIMDFVDGRVLATAAQTKELPAADADEVSRALIDALAQLHAIEVHGTPLESLGKPAGYLSRQVRRWKAQWDLTKTRELASVDALGAWLEGHCPSELPASGGTVVHGDFRLDNVILERGANQIAAVLDWEMATLGDPVADLGIALVYWAEPGDGLRAQVPVASGVTAWPGFWTREQLVSRYAQTTGDHMQRLDFCTALACFKLAVIMESIHFRQMSGQQLGAASTENMGRATEVLAELGLAVTRKGALGGLSA